MKYFKSLQFVNETTKSLETAEESTTNNEEDEDSMKVLTSGKKTKGRIKLKIEYMRNKVRRLTTFSKRKIGMMKKAYELAQLTGAQVMLLVGSETGHVYTFATDKLQPMVTSAQGKRLIESCLRDHNLIEASNLQPVLSEPYFHQEETARVDKHCSSSFPSSNISQELLIRPKGALKKLCADINKQSKKGKCNMSINRHKIEQSSLKKIINIVPLNDEHSTIDTQNDCYINNNLQLHSKKNRHSKIDNEKLIKVYGEDNVLSESYHMKSSFDENKLSLWNVHEQDKLQVMISPTVFGLIQANIKNGSHSDAISTTSTSEAINLIKNK